MTHTLVKNHGHKELNKLTVCLPKDPTILLLEMYLTEMKAYVHTKTWYTIVHSSFICNNQKLETIQMLINRWVGRQIMVYPCNGIYPAIKGPNDWHTLQHGLISQ